MLTHEEQLQLAKLAFDAADAELKKISDKLSRSADRDGRNPYQNQIIFDQTELLRVQFVALNAEVQKRFNTLCKLREAK